MITRKKTLSLIAFSLLALTTAHAAQTATGTNLQQNPRASKSNASTINPPVRPVLPDAVDFFIDGEFLWWKARETGLDFATKTTYYPNSSIFSPGSGSLIPTASSIQNNQFINNYSGNVKNPHFKWAPGFRVGIGFNMPFDGWDIYLNWTRLHTSECHGKAATNPTFGKIVIPEFQPFELPDQNLVYSSADPSWRLHYDSIDLELGREFYVSRRLTLRPFIGLREAWIRQKYKISTQGIGEVYTTQAITIDEVNVFLNDLTVYNTVRMKNDFNGLGPRAGLNTDWYLGAGFSIFGDFGVALLLGNFDVQYNATADAFLDPGVTVPPNPGPTEQFGTTTLSNGFHDTRATVDLGLGLRYAHKFSDDRYRVRVAVGWEAHEFFSQNQFISFENDILPIQLDSDGDIYPISSKLQANTERRGDLSLQGLTASVRFDF